MWHRKLNQGKQPADFTHGSEKKVRLRCRGCRHGCGRQHEWEARVKKLTRNKGRIVCPFCESKRRFCECQSVAANERLLAEWHPDNPPATQVAKASRRKYLWKCPNGHAPYMASCSNRYTQNTGCPVCADARLADTKHPLLSVGRPDLAKEWDVKNKDRSPNEFTLGSHYKAWWRCRDNPQHLPWHAVVKDRALKGSGCPSCTYTNRFKERIFGSIQQVR